MNEKQIEMIKTMKRMQFKLDDSIHEEHGTKYSFENTKRALIDELGEMNHESKADWCWWKYTQAPVDVQKLLEELADAWHFALSIDNHENCLVDLKIKDADIMKYQRYDISTLIAWAITKENMILAIMIALTEKLGFSIDGIYNAYIKKNQVNYERLHNGY